MTYSVVLASDGTTPSGITVANDAADYSTVTVTLPEETDVTLDTTSVEYVFTMTYTSAVCGTLTATTTQKLVRTYSVCSGLDISTLTLDGGETAPSAVSIEPQK